MISLLRSMIIAGVALFAASNVNATPVYDCEPEIEKGIDYGMKYLKANWDEFEQRIQAGGQEVASCVKDRVFNDGIISCDIVECPMPGLVAWTYPNHNEIFFCPWYYEERISHIKNYENKGACLASKAANTFAISCKDIGETHWDYYGSILVDMMKRDMPEIVIDGQLDCGHNRGLPLTLPTTGDKKFSM